MKPIGIVICNYNKKDAVLACIESVLESNMDDFDIYVVDNASTDGSVQAIQETYRDQVTLLANDINLGGSGGFNTGIRKVLEQDYSYVMCLDNDVLLDENAIQALYTFLETHPETGMVGSRVYHLEEPDYVQQFGLTIDFNKCCLETLYENHLEDGTIPEVVYCDAVATCSMMARTSAVKTIGVMPERNYIYWDDIEWGYLCGKAGYRVAAYGASKALHAMGAKKVSENTFPSYYIWRNWIHFFMKHTPEQELEKMSIVILQEAYKAIFECTYKEQHKLKETIVYAIHDAMNDNLGKAEPGKIFQADHPEDKMSELLKQNRSIAINLNGFEELRTEINDFMKERNDTIDLFWGENPEHELQLMICKSILQVKEPSEHLIYLDCLGNSIVDAEDRAFIRNYEFGLEFFLYSEQPHFLYQCKKLRGKISTDEE